MKEKDKDKDKEKKAKEKNKSFIDSHKQVILYFAFGIITTVCSLGACYATLKFGVMLPVFRTAQGEPNALLDIAGSTTQWITGVIVAFFTNKKWVFTDAPKGRSVALKQLMVFAFSRIGTYFLEAALNIAIIHLLALCGYKSFSIPLVLFTFNVTSRIWGKVISSVTVVITNYFLSKSIVFKNRIKE